MCNKVLVKLLSNVNCNYHSKYLSLYSHFSRNHYLHQGFTIAKFNYAGVYILHRQLNILAKNISNDCFLYQKCLHQPPLYSDRSLVRIQTYCTDKEGSLPKLMDFPQVIWPSVFKTFRNWILANFIIMRYFDNEFNLPDFVIGSKQAVEVVSGMIARGDADRLAGLVTPEVISQVKKSLKMFTLKQRQEFAIKADDIYFCFPYEVGVMFPNEERSEGENQCRFVEITMCYHALHGLKELREAGVNPPVNMGVIPEYQDKMFILNYRFICEFTKGVQDDWTINAINHFKPTVVL